jgi:hypothetical protein
MKADQPHYVQCFKKMTTCLAVGDIDVPVFELLLKLSTRKTNLFTTGQPVTLSILVTG